MILRPYYYYYYHGCAAYRESFIEALANVPAKPEEMEQILSFNRGTAQMRAQA
jgi:hypothetical protein